MIANDPSPVGVFALLTINKHMTHGLSHAYSLEQFCNPSGNETEGFIIRHDLFIQYTGLLHYGTTFAKLSLTTLHVEAKRPSLSRSI